MIKRWSICVFMTASLFFSQQGSCQDISEKRNQHYFAWTVGAGDLFFPRTSGKMQLSFPYSSTDENDNTSTDIFTSRPINPYRAPHPMVGCLIYEFGGIHSFVTGSVFSYYTSSSQVNFSLSYGRNFYFDLRNKAGEISARRFVLKPSLGIAFNKYSNSKNTRSDSYLGSIDNENRTVNFLGYSSGPTYSYTTGTHQHTAHTYVENVKELDFFFAQNVWAIVPKLSIANNPFTNVFHWEVNVGYYAPFYQKSGVEFLQDGTHRISSSSIVGLNADGLVTTFDNRTIRKSPYHFHGFFVSITAGININNKLMSKVLKKCQHLRS